MNKGIAIAGTMVMDVLNTMASYPARSELMRIDSIDYASGGGVMNTLRDLARLDPTLPLRAIGLVGEDAYGEALLADLKNYPSIDASLIGRAGRTSFSNVMAERQDSTRTFFYYPGANALLDMEHIPLDTLCCDIFHVAYILLLDKLDVEDPVYGTRMARLLHDAQERGMRTSVDVVSESGDRFMRLVPPALRYTDYLIVNELEAGATAGIPLRDSGGRLLRARIPDVLRRLKEKGVSRWVVIHAPEGGFGLDEEGRCAECPGALLPRGFIAGSVGAGDAFCAGVLAAAYRERPIEEALSWGTASAVCSLRKADASEGVAPLSEALALFNSLPRRSAE